MILFQSVQKNKGIHLSSQSSDCIEFSQDTLEIYSEMGQSSYLNPIRYSSPSELIKSLVVLIFI